MANTVDDFALAANGDYGSSQLAQFGDFFLQASSVVDFGKSLPNWWSRKRDKKMGSMWRDNTLLSVLMFAAETKIANMPIRVVAVDDNIESHRRLAIELTQQFQALSEFGQGLQEAMETFAEDYFGTDNGGFLEIVAEGDKTEPVVGIPLGIRHLDSHQVQRMSDPIFPIKYMRPDSKYEVFHHSRVISMSQMRSSRREMNGVGFCAISRTIEIAEKYQDLINYMRGKMGGRAFKRLIVGKNISGREIIKAIAASTAIQNEIGGMDVDSIAIGGKDIEVDAIDLTNFPEFNEEDATFNTMALMALGWGLEFNEAFPTVGSKASEEIALQRSRGRLPSLFVAKFGRQATAKMVPPYLSVEIDFVDDYLDQQREIIADIRARNLQRLVESKILTPEAARARLFQDRYISESVRLGMSLADGILPDGTPVLRVMLDPSFDDLIVVNREYLLGKADPVQVEDDAKRNLMYLWALTAETSSSFKHDRYRIASAALNELVAMYQKPVTVQPPAAAPEEPDVPEEAPPDESDENAPDEAQEGQEAKSLSIKTKEDARRYIDRFKEDMYEVLSRDGGPSDSELMDKMETAMVVLALLALGLANRSDIPSEQYAVIRRELSFVSDSAATIISRSVGGTDMGPTADRMASQLWRTYWDLWVHSGVNDGEYSWTLGATEKHCSNCLGYSQMGARPMSFWKELADSTGHYPRSSALECTGTNCDCEYS